MFKTYFLMAFYGLKSVFCSCERETSQGFINAAKFSKIEKLGVLPKTIRENSGIEMDSMGHYYLHSDGGNPAVIYRLNSQLELQEEKTNPLFKNIDWEDVTYANNQLLLADIGNNQLQRKVLQLWKSDGSVLHFEYPDNQRFDAEAITSIEDKIVVFTKSYSQNTKAFNINPNGTSTEIDSFKFSLAITAADVSQSGQYLALLSYGKIFIFELKNSVRPFAHPIYCVKTRRKQTEALVFKNENTLIFSNEQGAVYQLAIHRTDI